MGTATPSLFETRRIFLDVNSGSLDAALSDMADRLRESGDIKDPANLALRLIEREKLGCTGLGNGIAIPHCKLKGLDGVLLAVGVSREGIDFHALDGKPVRLIFLVLSPDEAPAIHLQALARISRLLKTPGIAEGVLASETPEQISRLLLEAEAKMPIA
ncbi:MAG: PTS sugar transporter subunit IIA [Thermoanaerobaculia bacterium]